MNFEYKNEIIFSSEWRNFVFSDLRLHIYYNVKQKPIWLVLLFFLISRLDGFSFCILSKIWLEKPKSFAFCIGRIFIVWQKTDIAELIYWTDSINLLKMRILLIQSYTRSPWGLTRRILIFNKFLEFVRIKYKLHYFCTLSHPEDAAEIKRETCQIFQSDLRNQIKLFFNS